MNKYSQFKRALKKIRNRNSKESTDDDSSTEKPKLSKNRFSFLRNSSNKKHSPKEKHRNSVDIADLQLHSDQYSEYLMNDTNLLKKLERKIQDGSLRKSSNSTTLSSLSENSTAVKFNSENSKPKTLPKLDSSTSNTKGNSNSLKLKQTRSQSLGGDLLLSSKSYAKSFNEKHSQTCLMSYSEEFLNSKSVNKQSNYSVQNASSSRLQILLRELLRYPDNLYIFLSYIIITFLLISTIYVAYQIEQLERNLISVLNNESQYVSVELPSSSSVSELVRARTLLMNQINRMNYLMQNLHSKVS